MKHMGKLTATSLLRSTDKPRTTFEILHSLFYIFKTVSGVLTSERSRTTEHLDQLTPSDFGPSFIPTGDATHWQVIRDGRILAKLVIAAKSIRRTN